MDNQAQESRSPESNDARWRQRAFRIWALVGFCVLVGVGIFIAGVVWQAVAVVVVTVLLVFLLHGFVNKLEEHKVPRWAGTTLAFLIIILVIVGCVLAVIPALVQQLTSFSSQIPTYLTEIQAFITKMSSTSSLFDGENLNKIINEAGSFIRNQAGTMASGLASGVMGGLVSAGNIALITFVSLICSFWILLDLPTIVRELNSLVSDKYKDDVHVVTNAFATSVYGWAKSTILCAIITGLVSWLAFVIMGIPYSALLGLLCGLFYFLPYIGPMISCAAVALIALFVSPLICIISIVVNMVINNVVANIISPKLMKDSVNVYPALILIAILVGSALGGIPGMLLSIPVVGALQGIFIAYFELLTGKKITTTDGVLFQLPKPKNNRSAKDVVKDAEAKAENVKEDIEKDVDTILHKKS